MNQDQAFFDKRNQQDIEGSMRAEGINNTITWNIPYIISLSTKFVIAVYFMFTINFTMASICMVTMGVFKLGFFDRIVKAEKITHKICSKLSQMKDQTLNESLNMISSIKVYSKERHHIKEHEIAARRYNENVDNIVFYRCVREFLVSTMQIATFCMVLYYVIGQIGLSGISSSGITTFFLLLSQLEELYNRLQWHCSQLIRDLNEVEKFVTLMETKPTMKNGTK
jgi:ABC-type multidrug transport system fused ATPase/permease subunit